MRNLFQHLLPTFAAILLLTSLGGCAMTRRRPLFGPPKAVSVLDGCVCALP